jgi:hypothetical protein
MQTTIIVSVTKIGKINDGRRLGNLTGDQVLLTQLAACTWEKSFRSFRAAPRSMGVEA